ncbi:MAG: hypothetical protein QW821_05160 [Candidatus Bathyarchaeia archaeon]
MRKSLQLSLIAVFAALHSILYFLSFGLWRNWAIYLEPLEGIILGPWIGCATAFIGSSVARFLKPDDFWMFGIIAEPLGVLVSAFLSRGKWQESIIIYFIMLTAYFVHPFGRALPLWTVLDIILAFALILPVAKIGKQIFEKDVKRLAVAVVLVSFVGIATDSLVRVFLLVPCGLYMLFNWSYDTLYGVFISGAISSYIEDLLVVIVSFLASVPLMLRLHKTPLLHILLEREKT